MSEQFKRMNRNSVITIDKERFNLKYNLLIIRETYRKLNLKSQSMKGFYDLLEITDDSYSKFLNTSYISNTDYLNMVNVLKSCGIPKECLALENAQKILVSKNLTKDFEAYCNATERKNKIQLLNLFSDDLIAEWSLNQEKFTPIIIAVYKLFSIAHRPNETLFHEASEVLDELVQLDFTDIDLNKKAFAGFITELAKTINKVEDLFPEFYAVAQQLKTEKTAQSIMNEVSNKLNELNALNLSEEDVKSAPFANMVKEMTDMILKIQNISIS